MKKLVFAVWCIALMIVACTDPSASNEQGQDDTTASSSSDNSKILTKADSTLIDSIVAYTNYVDRSKEIQATAQSVFPNINNEKDQLYLHFEDNKMVRMIFGQRNEKRESRDRFYFKDDEIVFYRVRFWDKKDNPKAGETNCYFKDGKLHKVVARGAPLQSEQLPQYITTLPYQVQPYDLDSMETAIIQKLNLFKSFMEAD